jgi:hypothetical protein
MKINKILAAGIAATLAVTSLSAVVSAEPVTKEFEMANTIGKIETKGSLGGRELALLATEDPATGTIVQNPALAAGTGTPAAGLVDTFVFIEDGTFTNDNGIIWLSKVKLNVTGIKGQKNSTSKTYTYEFKNYKATYDEFTGVWTKGEQVYDGSGLWWELESYASGEAPLNALDISQFVEVTSISIDVEAKNDGLDKATYTNWKNWNYADSLTCGKPFDTAAANVGVEKAINDAFQWYCGATMEITNQSTKDLYAFLEKTTSDTTINRNKVQVLSSANAYNSGTLYTGNGQREGNASRTQTYKDADGTGTAPFWFGGLASQCADFFNKQTNGKITFQFTAKTKDSTDWKEGGIASTEVGLKSTLAGTNIGIFVNYMQSTGSLVSQGVVDSDALTVTFDISDILDDMGGLTKGNISDIYYGMNKGLDYKSDDYTSIHAGEAGDVVDYAPNGIWYISDDKHHAIGYIVEKVILSYEDGADVEAAEEEVVDEPEDVEEPEDIEEPEEEEEEEPEDFEEEPEEEPEEEEEEPEFVIEPEEEEEENNGDVDIIEPTNDAKADDDANPGTGVALAVVPAIVAAAAVVVSKKRK